MSVRPVRFNPNGSLDVWDDDNGHGGTIALASIAFAAGDTDAIELGCPVCLARSVHPVEGGADPVRVQFMHALATLRRLRQSAPATTFAQAKAAVAQRIAQKGFRFLIANAAATDTDPTP